jgi:hypothetical protein
MNRLERIQLMERVEKAEATVARLEAFLKSYYGKDDALHQMIADALERIRALENKPKLGRPPKAMDGNGQDRATS